MPTKQAPVEFVEKVKARMNEENIGVRDLAKILGVSPPTVTELVTHGNRPSVDTCIALAKWLKQSDVTILREAGVLPPDLSNGINLEDWKHLLAQSLPEEEEETKQILTMKIDRRQKAEQSARVKNFKPKKAG
jgi:transcriptional regulator with XRE-family HTH domain